MKGLANATGSSCWMNATLQALLHAPALTMYFLEGLQSDDLLKKRINACAVTNAFAALAQAYWRSAQPLPDTAPLLRAFSKVHKAFATGQHDAHEALTLLLRSVHESLAKTTRIDPSLVKGHDTAAWAAYLASDGYSILTEMMVGQLESVYSDGGPDQRPTYDHFWGLSLSVHDCASVPQAIQKYLRDETIESLAVTKTVSKKFSYLPLVLPIHIKRFDNATNKIDKFVDYTTELDLTSCVRGNPSEPSKYDLFAVVLHAGDARGGHYTAMAEHRGRWEFADDASVVPMESVNSIIQKSAYILFYRKRLA